MENIIIKLRANEDRAIIFKMPNNVKPDLKLNLWPLRWGTINVSWDIEEYKKIEEAKDVGNIGKDIGKKVSNKQQRTKMVQVNSGENT